MQVVCWACSRARGLCWEVLIGSDKCSSVCLRLRTLLLGVLGVADWREEGLCFPVKALTCVCSSGLEYISRSQAQAAL